jgi:hypothetical protein
MSYEMRMQVPCRMDTYIFLNYWCRCESTSSQRSYLRGMRGRGKGNGTSLFYHVALCRTRWQVSRKGMAAPWGTQKRQGKPIIIIDKYSHWRHCITIDDFAERHPLFHDQRTRNMNYLATAVLGIFLFSGCTWVKPTPGGDQVRVASSPAEVANCREIGKTTVSLLDKVSFYKRNQKKIEDELFILGQNSAAEMGGDTILPVSDIFQGERRFAVYRCRGN